MYETHDKRALLLPNVTSADAGKVLAVDENGKLSLEEMGSGLPEVDSSDAGMLLTVDEDGEWKVGAPSEMTVIIPQVPTSVNESIEDILIAIENNIPVIGVYAGCYTCLLSYDYSTHGVSGVALHSFNSGTAGCYVISGYNDGTSDVWNVNDYSFFSGNGLYIMPFVVDGSNVSISGSAVRYVAQNHPPIVAAIDPQDSNQYVTVGLAYFGTDFANYGSSDYEVAINGFSWGIQFTYDSATDTYYYHPEN